MRIVQIRNREELDREIVGQQLPKYGKLYFYIKTIDTQDETEIEIANIKYPFIGVFQYEFHDNPYGRDDETLHIGVVTKVDAALLLTRNEST